MAAAGTSCGREEPAPRAVTPVAVAPFAPLEGLVVVVVEEDGVKARLDRVGDDSMIGAARLWRLERDGTVVGALQLGRATPPGWRPPPAMSRPPSITSSTSPTFKYLDTKNDPVTRAEGETFYLGIQPELAKEAADAEKAIIAAFASGDAQGGRSALNGAAALDVLAISEQEKVSSMP